MNTPINYQSFSKSANFAEKTFDEPPCDVTNKVTGDRMKLIHSPDSGFDSVKIEFTLPPQAKGAPLHYHLSFVETFAVIGGTLEMRVGSENRIVESGEAVTVPIRVPHSFNNPAADWVTFTTEIAPAGEFEKFIRAMYGLANDGKTNKTASEATKAAAVVVFEGFHQYAGVAIGEHLGQLFTAVWII